MSIEAVEDTDFFDYIDWVINTGLWDGRVVTLEEASDFYEETRWKLASLVFSEDFPIFQREKNMAALAFAGSLDKALLSKDVQELHFFKEDLIIKTGLGKFWKKHKKEILIGIGVAALITVIVVITACSVGAAAPVAVAANSLKRKKEDPPVEDPPEPDKEPLEPKSSLPEDPTPLQFDPSFLFNHNSERPLEEPSLENPFDRIVFKEDRVFINEQSFSYPELFDPTKKEALISSFYPKMPPSYFLFDSPQERSFIEGLLQKTFPESTPQEILAESSFEKAIIPVWKTKTSRRFETGGVKKSHLRIGGINGINTLLEGANSHGLYLKELALDHNIEWVYNQTHGSLSDLLEVWFLNYRGFSPNTSNLLKEQWTAFHEENIDRPNAKYLQFCHSQGAAHVATALLQIDEQIRNRIIVIAIAPAVVISKDLCYRSFNYASEKDFIPKLELVFYRSRETGKKGEISKPLEEALERHKQLILLKPHPDATGIDHDFQSPTFRERIEQHIENYLDQDGVYE